MWYVKNLTQASFRVENGNANSTAPGMTSSLGSAPKESTNLAAQIQNHRVRMRGWGGYFRNLHKQ